MKKVIGLFLVILISSVSVFAQNGKREGRKGDSSKRLEQMVAELKLNEKQTADFCKVQSDYRDKVKKERESAQTDRSKMREKMKAMRTEKNDQIKKILTDEQYKQYLAKSEQSRSSHKGKGRRS